MREVDDFLLLHRHRALELQRPVKLGNERAQGREGRVGDDGLVEGDLDGQGGLDDERSVFGRHDPCVSADLRRERGVAPRRGCRGCDGARHCGCSVSSRLGRVIEQVAVLLSACKVGGLDTVKVGKVGGGQSYIKAVRLKCSGASLCTGFVVVGDAEAILDHPIIDRYA